MTGTVDSRRKRGRETEKLAALAAANSLPATARVDLVASSVAGADIRITLAGGTVAAVECKAVRNLSLGDALAQAERNAGVDELPALVVRLNGSGPSDVHNWPCVIRYGQWLDILERLDTGSSSTTMDDGTHHLEATDLEREVGPVERGVNTAITAAEHLTPIEAGGVANALALAKFIDRMDLDPSTTGPARSGAADKLRAQLGALGLDSRNANTRHHTAPATLGLDPVAEILNRRAYR